MSPINRRSFVGQAAMGLAALTALGTTADADAELVYRPSDWKMATFDRILKHPARVKQVYDVIRINEGNFLDHIKNSLNGLQFGFAIPAEQIKIVSATHGPSNLLNYDDYVWEKYQIGAWLKVTDPKTGEPATRNIFDPSDAGNPPKYTSKDPNDDSSLYQDSSLQALRSRGVQFLSCHTAIEGQARAVIHVNKLSQQPEEVVKDLQAHTLPGVLIVPSMVASIALLQSEGHFTYITIG
ncbi:MAG TPA: hypothetical protein VHX63_05085 [Acidobacteriaceae bacterium]|nr:hypothetical protein [Acidobacteriaceae bacterium]